MINTVPVDFSGSLLSRDFIERNCATIFPARRSLIALYGLFLELTRQLYSTADNLLLNMNTIWDQDPVKSKIWIDTEYIWEDKTPEFRPAIYIALKGLKLESLVSPKSELGSSTKDGEVYYGKTIHGAVSFVHIGQTKGETVNLVDNTYSFLDGLSDIIRQDFCFQIFNVTDVTPLKVIKAEKDHLRGEIVATFTYNDYWSIKTESSKLKKIVLAATVASID